MPSQHPFETSEKVSAVGIDSEESLPIAAPRVDVVHTSCREIARRAGHEPTVLAAPGLDPPYAWTVTLLVQLHS